MDNYQFSLKKEVLKSRQELNHLVPDENQKSRGLHTYSNTDGVEAFWYGHYSVNVKSDIQCFSNLTIDTKILSWENTHQQVWIQIFSRMVATTIFCISVNINIYF